MFVVKPKITLLFCALISAIIAIGCAAVLSSAELQTFATDFGRKILGRNFGRDIGEIFATLKMSAKYLLICIALFWIAALSYLKLCDLTAKGFLQNYFASKISVKSDFFDFNKPRDRKFFIFAIALGGFVWIVALARAAETALTWDEAYTYLRYSAPNIFISSLPSMQTVNNHILNTFLIRLASFLTNTEYSELIIRFPNIFFAIIYIVFSYKISKNIKYSYFAFSLLIANYYLNEYFSLARGYSMSASAMVAALYYFIRFRANLLMFPAPPPPPPP